MRVQPLHRSWIAVRWTRNEKQSEGEGADLMKMTILLPSLASSPAGEATTVLTPLLTAALDRRVTLAYSTLCATMTTMTTEEAVARYHETTTAHQDLVRVRETTTATIEEAVETTIAIEITRLSTIAEAHPHAETGDRRRVVAPLRQSQQSLRSTKRDLYSARSWRLD